MSRTRGKHLVKPSRKCIDQRKGQLPDHALRVSLDVQQHLIWCCHEAKWQQQRLSYRYDRKQRPPPQMSRSTRVGKKRGAVVGRGNEGREVGKERVCGTLVSSQPTWELVPLPQSIFVDFFQRLSRNAFVILYPMPETISAKSTYVLAVYAGKAGCRRYLPAEPHVFSLSRFKTYTFQRDSSSLHCNREPAQVYSSRIACLVVSP